MRRTAWIAAMAAIACAASTDPSAGERAATPTFSPGAGTYASARAVTISSATPGAIVRCTQDGSTPTAASPTCAAPVTVSATTTLRAFATAAGYGDSDVATAVYTIDPSVPAAATPTFSPPAGTYGSAQTVTISSATAGAEVRCTQDGSTPTAASLPCAAPITVATTTTLRAIATASGHTPSAVASATYTISSGPPTLAEALQALSTRRQLLAHQSVGDNILYGDSGSRGLLGILQDHPGSGVTIRYEPASAALAVFPLGGWADTAVGANGDPVGKIDDFDRQVRERFSGALDYYAFKLCFTDFQDDEDVAAIWAEYQLVLDRLEADFPGRIVHWTVPLMPDASDVPGNTRREELSEHIRAKYGPTGRVFDLADLEAHDAAGNPVRLGGVRALALDWSADGAREGHLNDAGADRLARAYVEFMYGVAGPAGP